jgi:hypothetical protein
VAAFVAAALLGGRLSERHGCDLRFLVPAATVKKLGIGATFALLERSAAGLGVAAWSLSQTTLEQVFLRVAKDDDDEDDAFAAAGAAGGASVGAAAGGGISGLAGGEGLVTGLSSAAAPEATPLLQAHT